VITHRIAIPEKEYESRFSVWLTQRQKNPLAILVDVQGKVTQAMYKVIAKATTYHQTQRSVARRVGDFMHNPTGW
jgi:predicted phosphoadenosine phosphosulfate sulfurtransferase